jgi:GDP-L-fucose synthase
VLDGARVLVAGATGFIGRNLSARLVASGAKVRGAARSAEPRRRIEGVEYLRADLTRPDDCRRAVQGMDVVFMCAASTAGAAVMTTTPLAQVTPNVVMNAHVMDAAYAAGVRKFVFISSSAAYPPTDARPVTEDEMFLGDPYDVYYSVGWMKRYAEVLCRIYATKITRPMPTVVVRPSNAYGPWDKFDFAVSHVTGALIRRVVERHRPLEVWGTGEDVRDLIYIDDLVEGIVRATEHEAPHVVVNIASGRGHSVREVLETLLEVDGYTDAEVRFDPTRPRTIPIRLVDTSHAKTLLGFEARTSLREGLQRTVAWYRRTYPRGFGAPA